jgi:hypothetical protein
MSRVKKRKRSLPCALAWYIAVSPCWISTSASMASSGKRTMPMLADACTSWPERSKGDRSCASSFSATRWPRHRRRAPPGGGRRTRPRRRGRRCRRRARQPQALGDGAQQRVADGVAERVVGDLEVVEVEEQGGAAAAAAHAAGDRLAEAVAQQRAVRQARQRVVVRHALEFALERAALDQRRGLGGERGRELRAASSKALGLRKASRVRVATRRPSRWIGTVRLAATA